MMFKKTLHFLCLTFIATTLYAQAPKSYNWEQGQCGHTTNIVGDYECFIYVWGKADDGTDALLQFVEKVEDGDFLVYLSQTLMTKDLALNGRQLKSKFSFSVDERIPLDFTAANTVITFDRQYPIAHVKIPVTENVFTYLEHGRQTITTVYEKSDGGEGRSTFRTTGYGKQLAIMSLKVRQLKR